MCQGKLCSEYNLPSPRNPHDDAGVVWDGLCLIERGLTVSVCGRQPGTWELAYGKAMSNRYNFSDMINPRLKEPVTSNLAKSLERSRSDPSEGDGGTLRDRRLS
ncbi:hypothetical protein PCANC_12877 [Puccinia coronata f. sp. avenae]|uniref:Uncharacterized protein n=1 Tax=Puccinia coronata f. sp. avenae TaxID=200324 RepID=A0A2N5VE73_9BASI|nr:hypothetical protein PCANC_12877 [Puccinia coronata f. sp. avenae]